MKEELYNYINNMITTKGFDNFTSSIIASTGGFEKEIYFEATEGAKEVPVVDFS